MRLPNHVNPDHHLETPNGRVWSAERGKQAWDAAYVELESTLRAVGAKGKLYVVCGIQASGKSTWITRNAAALGSHAVFFDAALPSRKHRTRALGVATMSVSPSRRSVMCYPSWSRHALREGFVEVVEVSE